MIFRQEAPRLVLKMTVCLAVAGGCAFLGCSSDYGTSPSNKNEVKEALNTGETNQAGKGSRIKIAPKSIKQKALNAAPAS